MCHNGLVVIAQEIHNVHKFLAELQTFKPNKNEEVLFEFLTSGDSMKTVLPFNKKALLEILASRNLNSLPDPREKTILLNRKSSNIFKITKKPSLRFVHQSQEQSEMSSVSQLGPPSPSPQRSKSKVTFNLPDEVQPSEKQPEKAFEPFKVVPTSQQPRSGPVLASRGDQPCLSPVKAIQDSNFNFNHSPGHNTSTMDKSTLPIKSSFRIGSNYSKDKANKDSPDRRVGSPQVKIPNADSLKNKIKIIATNRQTPNQSNSPQPKFSPIENAFVRKPSALASPAPPTKMPVFPPSPSSQASSTNKTSSQVFKSLEGDYPYVLTGAGRYAFTPVKEQKKEIKENNIFQNQVREKKLSISRVEDFKWEKTTTGCGTPNKSPTGDKFGANALSLGTEPSDGSTLLAVPSAFVGSIRALNQLDSMARFGKHSTLRLDSDLSISLQSANRTPKNDVSLLLSSPFGNG